MTDTTTAAPKPETWEQEAWDALKAGEQWVINGLHELGYIVTNDVWPALKAALSIFGSQIFPAVFKAVSASIADPELIIPAVGAAIVTTASTQGIVDATNFVASAEAAVKADPTVQAFITNGAAGN